MSNPIALSSTLLRSIVYIVILTFTCTIVGPLPVYAQTGKEIHLPAPGVRVHLSPEFNPPILKGIKVHTDNIMRFDFILDKGDGSLGQEQLKAESIKLIKYFLASITIPDKDLWVNLSPYEKDRIIPNSFGLTEMGRDLLAQDYMLKQITASLIYPEDETGKKFWKRVYEEAARRYKTTNIPVNTFNKVWIVPEKAVVYENAKAGAAYVVQSKLKVMLEQDYLTIQKNQRQPGDMALAVSPSTLPSETAMNGKATQSQSTNALGSQIVREIVLPELEKEVNEGKNFAQLRQVYNSLILATWYKKKIKDSILAKVYADKNKIAGVKYDQSILKGMPTRGHVQTGTTKNVSSSSQRNEPNDVEGIYQQYLSAFKKGVYNYIKEEIDPMTQETIPRKYFSGGVDFMMDSEQRTSLGLSPEVVSFTSDQTMVSNINLNGDNALQVTADMSMTQNLGSKQDQMMKADPNIFSMTNPYNGAYSLDEVTYNNQLVRKFKKGQGVAIPLETFSNLESVDLWLEANDPARGDENIVRLSRSGTGTIFVKAIRKRGGVEVPVADADEPLTIPQNNDKVRAYLGRSSKNVDGIQQIKVFVDDESVSRQHLEITIEQGWLIIKTISGTNASYLSKEVFERLLSQISSMPHLEGAKYGVDDLNLDFEEGDAITATRDDVQDNIRQHLGFTGDDTWEDETPEDATSEERVEAVTVRPADLVSQPVEDARRLVKDKIVSRNGFTGLNLQALPSGGIRRWQLNGQEANSNQYKNLVKAVELALNYIFTEDGSVQQQLIDESDNLDPIQSAQGYHNFRRLTARDVLVGDDRAESLPLNVRRAFLSGAIDISSYVDGDLMRDMIRHLGGKNDRSKPMVEILKEYFELIYEFETARTSKHLVTVLGDLISVYKSYKFAKFYEVGREKTYVQGQLLYNESKAIADLSPKMSAFRLVNSNSLRDFVGFVQENSSDANESNFYIFNKKFRWKGRSWIVAARNGRIELYYTSQTYSRVAGQEQWSRQEAALGVNGDIKWYGKPAVESAHDVSDSSSLKINQLVGNKKETHLTTEEMVNIHMALGILYGPDGTQIDGPKQIDFSRFPAWVGFGFRYAQSEAATEELLAASVRSRPADRDVLIAQEINLKLLNLAKVIKRGDVESYDLDGQEFYVRTGDTIIAIKKHDEGWYYAVRINPNDSNHILSNPDSLIADPSGDKILRISKTHRQGFFMMNERPSTVQIDPLVQENHGTITISASQEQVTVDAKEGDVRIKIGEFIPGDLGADFALNAEARDNISSDVKKTELITAMSKKDTLKLGDLLPIDKEWYKKAHPGTYHGVEHSVETGFAEALFAWARKQKGILSEEEVLLLWQVALLHDFEPRTANTMAHVPATLENLAQDWGRTISLSGQPSYSVLQDEFGWSELQYWIARAIIQRSEFPFGKAHGNLFYKRNQTSPLQEYEKILRRINELDTSGKSVSFVMREAYLFSEIIDKANGYMRKDIESAKQMVVDLSRELVYEGAEVTPQMILKGSYAFLSSIGEQKSFELDDQLRLKLQGEGISIDNFEFLSRTQVFEFLPSNYVTQFNENLQGFQRIARDGMMEGDLKKGGIDFTAEKTPLEIQDFGESIKFNVDAAMLQKLQNASGFTPNIVNIQSLIDLKLFLGISDGN